MCLDLSPVELSSSSYIDVAPTLHLIAYSVNQKGRSEPTVLEDIAINEAVKRTGRHRASLLPPWKNELVELLCFIVSAVMFILCALCLEKTR